MYYPYFIAYIVVGFAVTLVAVLWALRNGQFRDQERARFFPLADAPEQRPVKASRLHRLEALVLALLACAGLMATAAVLIFSLLRVP
jgi:cbb3-type cytochrome oxidase maturation protein